MRAYSRRGVGSIWCWTIMGGLPTWSGLDERASHLDWLMNLDQIPTKTVIWFSRCWILIWKLADLESQSSGSWWFSITRSHDLSQVIWKPAQMSQKPRSLPGSNQIADHRSDHDLGYDLDSYLEGQVKPAKLGWFSRSLPDHQITKTWNDPRSAGRSGSSSR